MRLDILGVQHVGGRSSVGNSGLEAGYRGTRQQGRASR